MTSAVELQSISTLEAIASGLPVVAAHARALPELVADGVEWVPGAAGRRHRFAQAMRYPSGDPERAPGDGRGGPRSGPKSTGCRGLRSGTKPCCMGS